MKREYFQILFLISAFCLLSCNKNQKEQTNNQQATTANQDQASNTNSVTPIHKRLGKYVQVKLTSDLNGLSAKEKQMLPLLIEIAQIMDDLFWYEAYGNRDSLLTVVKDGATHKFVEINYGPWDRLENNAPFIPGVGPKPETANFYPKDITKAEFEKANLKDKKSHYTFLRRDAQGKLITVPYHVQFKTQVEKAASLLREAAGLAEDAGLKKYLALRAEALLTDKYQPSDLAWMDMKTNTIDFVVGPIEVYEDKLYNYKAAHEAYVLVKDQAWSKRLAKYAAFLPELQKGLPVPAKYKTETPGTDSDLNAYDVIYYAGDCNSGSKTIAINLPNDEEVQLKKGTRRLQLKNAMQAKFDKIMVPITQTLIAQDQQQLVNFDAFFATTMFHEVAHGLGIKNTINKKGTVRDALKEQGSALEEGKADILGLYMITQLHKKGQIEGDLKSYYTTFLAGIFRSVRFGAASAHGQANMVRFNFFAQNGAFVRDAATGTYRVDFEKMEQAMNKLSEKILTLQGDGDYTGVKQLLTEQGKISTELQNDLNLLAQAEIPVDVVFEQGKEVLGL
ncbi:dipeptidyl-peptidase 3 family protein [Adhaeribacter radiodurans]|uniref:Zn-dependent hydrolase n=1 Tax=Adhaeribacter radiodurans TaxID=2745197 RepID=A0A7L7LD03_9BACT|nr:Zn-dependent hydrolase [Adhaeribacter radiodurans]QMU30700.1 Zn-dependent hydrolase [Adhaeribacter radiodurans]